METHRGSCHCGAVRFEVDARIERLLVCNCSICARTGYLHVYVPPERFRLRSGEDVLTTYLWGTKAARHLFCRVCGISAFRHPRSDPDLYDINARCLEGIDLEALPIDHFDGRQWERSVQQRQLEPLRRMAAPAVRAILFDADGVLQHPTDDLEARIEGALGFRPDDFDGFVRDMFGAIGPTLVGGDVVVALEPVVARWAAPGRAAGLLERLECSVVADQALLRLIQELRTRGLVCALATNQHRFRASYMNRALGYAECFDRLYYSSELGFVKPDPRYFRAVLDDLPFSAGELLFIDDREDNVAAAWEAGMQAARFVHPGGADSEAAMRALLQGFSMASHG